MSTSPRKSKSFPVTVTHLPTVRCSICGRTVAHRDSAADALTEHYRRSHPEQLEGKRS